MQASLNLTFQSALTSVRVQHDFVADLDFHGLHDYLDAIAYHRLEHRLQQRS